MSKETKFEWNDKAAVELAEYVSTHTKGVVASVTGDYTKLVNDFKQSKEKELHKGSEKIVVSHLSAHDNFKGHDTAHWYQFCSSKPLYNYPNSKIIESIEKTVNGELDTKPSPDTLREGKEWEIVTWFARDGALASLVSGTYEGNLKAGYTIRSVRRLSDNEVFTIGDTVTYKEARYLPYIITNFFIKDDKILARSEGNNYCEFVDDNLIKQGKVVTDNSDVACLSANDIKKWLEKYFDYPNGISVTQLNELVNQKLKQ